MDLNIVKNDLYQVILDAQNGKYDRQDKVRHEAGLPLGIGVMRLGEISEIDPRVAVQVLKLLQEEGRIIIHDDGMMGLSFEAIEPVVL